MAYLNGSANSFVDLKANLISACVANGWSNSGDIIWKGGSFFEITNTSTYLQIYGGKNQSGGVLSTKSPYGARLGGSYFTFPIAYEINIFENPDEVYLIANYNTDYYQQMSFGTSAIAGAGAEPWFTSTHNTTSGVSGTNGVNICYDQSGGIYAFPFATVSTNSVGLFIKGVWSGEVAASFIYTTAKGTSGWAGYNAAGSHVLSNGGSASLVKGLLDCLPSAFNNATVLLPIKAVLDVGSNGRAVVASLNNARFCRLDYVQPGDIITYGQERWKLYPWLRNNVSVRNGADNSTAAPPNHTGTLGYAIRYTG
jgi:hypothetical protein